MACQSTFSPWPPPIPEFHAFNWVKNLCPTFKYLERPALMESKSNKVFVNCFFKGDNGSSDIVTNLIF